MPKFVSTENASNSLNSTFINLDNTIKKLYEDINRLNQVINTQSRSQTELNNKSNKVASTTTRLSALERERIRVAEQTRRVFAQNLAIQERSTQTLIRGQVRLTEARRLAREEARRELGITRQRSTFARDLSTQLIGAATATAFFVKGFQFIVNTIKEGINTVTTFEKSMSDVKAITGATEDEFNQLQNSAKNLGSTTEKTASEVAQLQKEFSKLGFSTKEILNATEATINLSIAAGSDLSESATVAASTIRGFGLNAKEAKRVTDVMAKSFTSSALDLQKFKVAMSIAAPVAKSFGKDIEFTTAQIGILSDAGLDASTAGTSLRNMFLELNSKGLTWEEGLEKINNSTNKNVTALDLFGKRGATAALILAENSDKAKILESKLDNAAGSAKKMADIMADNLAGDVNKAKSAFEGLMLNLIDTKAMRGVVQITTRLLNNINSFIKPKEKTINLYKLENRELNTLFGTLKNTNISSEARNKVMKKINDEYGQYLPSLLTEKSTLQDIEKAQIAVNKQLRLKVIQQAFQDEMNELLKKELDANEALINSEIEKDAITQKSILSTDEMQSKALDLQKEFLDNADLLNKGIIENNKNEVKSTEEKFKRIGELYKITFDEISNIIDESTEKQISSINDIQDLENDTFNNFIKNAKDKTTKISQEAEKQIQINQNILDVEFELFEENLNRELDSELRKEELLAEEKLKIAEWEAQEKLKREELLAEAVSNLKNETEQSVINIATDQYDNFIDNKLEKAKLEQDTQQELLKNRLDKGIISEAEYEKQLAKINLKAKQEEAKAEKKKALFSIAVSTAVEIAKVLATPFLIPPIIAAGGVQAAAVALNPIPQFFKGVENFEGGLAKVGEQGREIIQTNGQMYITPPNETLVNLPKGSNVIPNKKSEQIINKIENSGLEIQELKSINNNLKNINIRTLTWTQRALVEVSNNNKQKNIYLDQYIR